MIAPNVKTLHAFFNDYYRPLRLRGKSANTIRLYGNTLGNFQKFLCRAPTLEDLEDDTVARMMCWMVDRGRSPYTVNKERSQLLAIWRFACRKGFVAIWPDVEAEVQPERIPRAWTTGQIDKLFTACMETPGTFGPVPRNLWWYGLHLLGWDTGERINPLRKALWRWVELEEGLMRVPAEARKGRRADRVYPLHAETISVLRRIQTPRRDEVFPWPYSDTYIYTLYAKVQARAGLPVGREFRFHCLRKSVASHGKAAGLDPQELMGHVDGRTTRKYLDPNICGGKSASEVLFRPNVKSIKPDTENGRSDDQDGQSLSTG